MWKRNFLFRSKNVYQGDFFGDKFHGERVLFKGNGDMIEGHFENGLIKGKASFYPNDGEPYDINTEEDFENNNDNDNNMDKNNNDINSSMENTQSNIND